MKFSRMLLLFLALAVCITSIVACDGLTDNSSMTYYCMEFHAVATMEDGSKEEEHIVVENQDDFLVIKVKSDHSYMAMYQGYAFQGSWSDDEGYIVLNGMEVVVPTGNFVLSTEQDEKGYYVADVSGEVDGYSFTANFKFVKGEDKDDNFFNADDAQYVITFETGTDEKFDDIYVAVGQQFNLPQPNLDGYKFLGWYEGDVKYEDGIWTTARDVHLVAKWQKNTATVKFDYADGTGKFEEYDNWELGEEILLPSAQRDGYEFIGWKAGDTLITSDKYKLTEDVTFTAQWKGKQYNIFADAENGDEIYNLTYTVSEQGSTVMLPDVKKNGYSLVGWSVEWQDQSQYGQTLPVATATNLNIHAGCYGDIKVTAIWGEGSSEGLVYTLKNDVYYVSGYTGNDDEVYIPNTYNGIDVVGISQRAFADCDHITKVFVKENLQYVGLDAFYNCTNLTQVHTDSLSSWMSIEFVNMFANPLFYGHNLYVDGQLLTDVVIDNQERIGEFAFSGCTSIESVTLSLGEYYEQPVQFGASAFYGCINLTSVNVEMIEQWMFNYFANETANPLYYANKLYVGGELLTQLEVPENVHEISQYAFYNCTTIVQVTIYWVDNIGEDAFEGCTSIKEVVNCSYLDIYAGLSSHGKIAQYASKVVSSSESSQLYIVDGYVFYYNNGLYQLVSYIGRESQLNLPEKINEHPYEIGYRAFYCNDNITSVNISGGVNTVSGSAFEGCTNLADVVISSYVTQISANSFIGTAFFNNKKNWQDGVLYLGDMLIKASEDVAPDYTIRQSTRLIADNAFADCQTLNSITFNPELGTIGYRAFYNCNNLAVVNWNSSITDVNDEAFAMCYALSDVNIDDLASWCTTEFFGDTATPLWIAKRLNLNGQHITDLVIPETIETVKSYTFSGYDSLRTVVVPDSVRFIEQAFSDCVNITSVKFGNNVETIGSMAFSNCLSLEEIVLPDSVTQLGYYAFSGCIGLKNVVFSRNLYYIGNNAFDSCVGLKQVVIPDSVVSVGEEAFFSCLNLTVVRLGSGLESIGDDAFFGCEKLVEVINLSSLYIYTGDETNGEVARYALVVYNEVPETNNFTTTEDGYVFYSFDGMYYLVGYIGSATQLVLPENFNGSDYSIYTNAIACNNTVNSVVISAGVTSIYDYAFVDCYNIVEVVNLSALDIVAGSRDNGGVAYYAKKVLTALPQQGFIEVGDYTFYNDNGNYTLVQYNGNEQQLILPEYCNGNVYAIENYAFAGNARITSVVIPDTVAGVGEGAFANCTNLYSIKLPSGITEIKDRTFYGCLTLETIEIPDGVQRIGADAFYGCNKLSSVGMSSQITEIGEDVFYYCLELNSVNIKDLAGWCQVEFNNLYSNPLNYATNLYLDGQLLTDLVIPDGVDAINSYAFARCNVETITIPDSVKTIGASAFTGSSALRIEFGNGLTSIGDRAFYFSKALRIDIPDSVTTIGEGAFMFSDNLNTVTIGNGVTQIGRDAFNDCANLSAVVMGNSIEIVDYSVFGSCNNLNAVYITDLEQWCSVQFLSESANPLSNGAGLYLNGELVVDLVLPDGLKSVGDYAFCGAENLSSVTVPSSVVSMGTDAFNIYGQIEKVYISDIALWCAIDFATQRSNPLNFSTLYLNDEVVSDLVIPDGVEKISNYAFSGCFSITNVTLPDSLAVVGAYSFTQCSNLTTVSTTENLGVIGEGAFDGSIQLTEISLPYGLYTLGERAFANTNIYSIEIPSGITYLQNYVFMNCHGLVEVTMTGITRIGVSAFENCTALVNVTAGAVTVVENSAFSGCYSLADLHFEDSLQVIKENAFRGCYSLQNVTLPSVTEIGNNSFDGASIVQLTLGDLLTTVGDYAFAGCSVEQFTLPDGVQYIGQGVLYQNNVTSIVLPYLGSSGDDARALSYLFCDMEGNTYDVVPSSLKSVEIKNGELVDWAFEQCSSITTVVLGNGITRIGYGALDCVSLESLTIPFVGCDGSATNSHFGYVFGAISYTDQWGLIPGTLKYLTVNGGSVLQNAFYGCSNSLYVTLNDGVDIISANSFKNSGVYRVEIADSVTSIMESAFEGCRNLSTVVMGNGVTHIGERAFYNCSSLRSVTMPSTVNYIKADAFYNCGVDYLYTNGIYDWCAIDFENVYSNPLFNNPDLYVDGVLVVDLEIPYGVTRVKKYAFVGWNKLNSVSVPATMMYFGSDAFSLDPLIQRNVYIDDLSAWLNVRFENVGANPLSQAVLYIAGQKVTDLVLPQPTSLSVGNYAFYGCLNIESVVISDGVTDIGESAFYGCPLLGEVVIADSVKTIGNYAFANCDELMRVVMGSGVENVGEDVFYGCNKLVEFVNLSSANFTVPNVIGYFDYLPEQNNFTHYDDGYVFYSHENERYIVNYSAKGDIALPDVGSYIIPSNLFSNDSSITSVSIPSAVDEIKSFAFNGCTNLAIIQMEGAPKIGVSAFYGTEFYHNQDNWVDGLLYLGNCLLNCNVEGDVVVRDGVTKISDSAFANCNVTSVVLPYGVTAIGNNAFEYCYNLKSVVIPETVTYIGERAFAYCNQLQSVALHSVAAIEEETFLGCSSLNPVTLPDTLQSIGDFAFSGCGALTSVVVPDSVTYMGNSVFAYCDGLTSIELPFVGNTALDPYCFSVLFDNFGNYGTLPQGLEEITINGGIICERAFAGNIASVITLNDGVTYIGNNAFYNCVNLVNVYIPDSVTYIGEDAFYGCTGIQTMSLPFLGDRLEDPTSTGIAHLFGDAYWNKPDQLTSVTVRNGEIGDSAFEGCEDLTEVVLPDGATYIGSGAFYGCSSLVTVTLPQSITEMGTNAFMNCTALTSIIMPENVTTIGYWAFNNCYNLQEVYYCGSESQWQDVYIDESNTSITSATVYYYSETQPTTAGNYWHYVNGVVTVW